MTLDKGCINSRVDGVSGNLTQEHSQVYIRQHVIRERQERNKRVITCVSLCIGLLTIVGLACGFRVEQGESGKLLTQLRKLVVYTNSTRNSTINTRSNIIIFVDMRLNYPFTAMVVGPTGSGKTVEVMRLITNAAIITTPLPKEIINIAIECGEKCSKIIRQLK